METLADTRTLLLEPLNSLVYNSPLILSFHTSHAILPSSGEDGIFLFLPGFGIMFTYLWEVLKFLKGNQSEIYLLSFYSAAYGTELTGLLSSGV